MTCRAPGCINHARKLGLCDRHRRRMEIYGSFDLPTRLPIANLVELVEGRGGPGVCTTDRAAIRAYYNAKASDSALFPLQADRLSFALLGCHPAEVWPDAWFSYA